MESYNKVQNHVNLVVVNFFGGKSHGKNHKLKNKIK